MHVPDNKTSEVPPLLNGTVEQARHRENSTVTVVFGLGGFNMLKCSTCSMSTWRPFFPRTRDQRYARAPQEAAKEEPKHTCHLGLRTALSFASWMRLSEDKYNILRLKGGRPAVWGGCCPAQGNRGGG